MKGSRFHISFVILLSVLIVGAWSVDASANPQVGLTHYRNHEFDEAIEVCKDGKDLMSKMVLALAYTERYNIFKIKSDKQYAEAFIKLVEVEINVEDARMIEGFLGAGGNPNGNKVAAKFLKKAFENAATSSKEMLLMASFLNPDKGIEANKLALSEIVKRLGPVRAYVDKGGTMPKEVRSEVFSNANIINPLISCLADKKTGSSARKCLVLIEEPALEHLEAADVSVGIADTILAVNKAIERRKKKYPQSTWFSAHGQ